MPRAPNLLNDDGTASVATAIMMTHHGLRRDLALFARAVQALAGKDPASQTAMKQEWQSYRNTLHGHHGAEDERLFPYLRSQHPGLTPVIDQLTADHREIDPLLERGDRAFAELPAAAAAAAVLADLSAVLNAHLATEEAQAIPFLRAVRTFPPLESEEEADLYAQGFAWGCHGIAPDVIEQVYAMLPEMLRSRLPAARAAYEHRCARVWGSTDTGASRTAIPDWLPGG